MQLMPKAVYPWIYYLQIPCYGPEIHENTDLHKMILTVKLTGPKLFSAKDGIRINQLRLDPTISVVR